MARASVILLVGLLTSGCRASREGSGSRRGTLVCVPGFLRGKGCLWAAGRALQADGWRVEHWAYPSRERTIARHAERLTAELNRIASAHPGEPIAFVTHSLGGLVVRAALNRPDSPTEARAGVAVLMAPPNRGSVLARRLRGSSLARLGFGPASGRELMEAEDFDGLGSFPEGMRVLVVAGDFGFNPWIPGPDDGKVGVEETRLGTPHAFLKVHAGHSWIGWSPTAIRETRGFLKKGEM